MLRRLRQSWATLRSGYWFVPTMIVGFAAAMAFGLVELDSRLDADDRRAGFTGGPGSARELLSTIASSTLTLTALVFSVSVIVLQLASGQFSPRVLRTFLRDQRNQATLGVFLGTFMYALLVLREIRGEDVAVDKFVPGVAVAFSFVLVVLSIGLFIQYIHNITRSIRVIEIIDRVSRETIDAIDVAHPRDASVAPPPDVGPASATIGADDRGVVTSVDHDRLARRAQRCGVVLAVVPRPGEFVATGMPLVTVHGDASGVDADAARDIRAAIRLEKERDLNDDPAFGFRQLVDIAERALSPGVNDPTTASQCLDHLHDLLRHLADRPLPAQRVHARGDAIWVIAPRPTWDDYVALAFDEIRHWGADSIQVDQRVATILDDLAGVVADDRRLAIEARMSGR